MMIFDSKFGLRGLNETIIDEIEKAEGWPKYTNDPDDRGGPTKGGITIKTLEGWRGRSLEPADVKSLDRSEARAIYLQKFINEPGFAQIENDLLRYQMVDCGVLHGPRRPSRWLQQSMNEIESERLTPLNLAVDGHIGPRTITALGSMASVCDSLNLRIAILRIRFLAGIVSRDPSQAKYIRGWLNRATKFMVYLDQERFRVAL